MSERVRTGRSGRRPSRGPRWRGARACHLCAARCWCRCRCRCRFRCRCRCKCRCRCRWCRCRWCRCSYTLWPGRLRGRGCFGRAGEDGASVRPLLAAPAVPAVPATPAAPVTVIPPGPAHTGDTMSANTLAVKHWIWSMVLGPATSRRAFHPEILRSRAPANTI